MTQHPSPARQPLDVIEKSSNMLIGGDGGCRTDNVKPQVIGGLVIGGQVIGTGLNKYGQPLQPMQPKPAAEPLRIDLPDSLSKLMQGDGPVFGMAAYQANAVRSWIASKGCTSERLAIKRFTIRITCGPLGTSWQVRDDETKEVFDVDTSIVGVPKPVDLSQLLPRGEVTI